MIDEKAERKKGRDYLWEPIHQLLEKGLIKNVINIGGGASTEWFDLISKYNLMLHVLDEYEGHGSQISIQTINQTLDSHASDIKKSIKILKANALSFNYKKNEYDLIYARDSLHHIAPFKDGSLQKLESLFNKLHSSLRNGGYFYIHDVGRLNLLQFLRPFLPEGLAEIDYSTKTNLSEYLAILAKTGFRVLETHYYVPYKLRLFRKFLANAAANSLFTSAFIIHAIKK